MNKTRAELLKEREGHLGMIRTLQVTNRKLEAKLLGDDVLSAHRLPLTRTAMHAIADISPKGARCVRKDGWFYVLKPD